MKKNNKGFTLAELLIVVAIIAVLAAISIPVFTARLESSREATDISNLRSAYALAQSGILAGNIDVEGETDNLITFSGIEGTSYSCFYDITNGKFVKVKSDNCKGSGSSKKGGTTISLPDGVYYDQDVDASKMFLQVNFVKDGEGNWALKKTDTGTKTAGIQFVTVN